MGFEELRSKTEHKGADEEVERREPTNVTTKYVDGHRETWHSYDDGKSWEMVQSS